MFGFLRFLFRIVLFILIIGAVAGYFTNPTKADFAEKADRELRRRLSEQGAPDQLSGASGALTRDLIESMVRHTNYYAFGIFTIKVPMSQEYQFLGIFGTFIPLQQETPLEWTESRVAQP